MAHDQTSLEAAPTAAPQTTATPLSATPLCMHIRSKRMYITNTFEAESQADEDKEHCYGHYWCMKTMFNMGPDDQRVHRKPQSYE